MMRIVTIAQFRTKKDKPKKWEFNVFQVSQASKQRPLTYVLYELLKKYGLLSTFKVKFHGKMCLDMMSLWLMFAPAINGTILMFRYPPMYWWISLIVLTRVTASFGIHTTIPTMRPMLPKQHTSLCVRLVSSVFTKLWSRRTSPTDASKWLILAEPSKHDNWTYK